ncbi:hypothetical protein K491DRAFT_630282 [Lophiostoma macrostomum CBS 122681]|uniref:Zn(2)-C6 fungal-type domain-containing protein n=1 Tax=Lophiostoma macrostomum CBS 122681 TaxID=1314788 RepID=A0A6A6T8X6_9PLEO|nr:hypothetical protein K491DRAFT_630282 [Lophiostoma macrostomum CBS 122681]
MSVVQPTNPSTFPDGAEEALPQQRYRLSGAHAWARTPTPSDPCRSSLPLPHYMAHGQQPPVPRQRLAIACRYCRRRKLRCSGFAASDDGRCSNCARSGQDCIFTRVSAQTENFVPAHGTWRGAAQTPLMYGAYGQPLISAAKPEAGIILAQNLGPHSLPMNSPVTTEPRQILNPVLAPTPTFPDGKPINVRLPSGSKVRDSSAENISTTDDDATLNRGDSIYDTLDVTRADGRTAAQELWCSQEPPNEDHSSSNESRCNTVNKLRIHPPRLTPDVKASISERLPDNATVANKERSLEKGDSVILVKDEHQRLKCPFYQRDPEKHTRGSCRGVGFADLGKLKDHLKRVHCQPLRCTRCREEMGSDEAYAEHLQRDDICTKRPEIIDDRISAKLWLKLEFKKPPFSLHSSTEVKWRLMYKTLFPDDSEIPTPYDQHGISSRVEQILAEALEEELTREPGSALDPTISRIRGRIPLIIKRFKSRVAGNPGGSEHEEAEVIERSWMNTGINQKDLETKAVTGSARKIEPTHRSALLNQPSATSSCPTSTITFDESAGLHVLDAPAAKSVGESLGKELQRHSPSHNQLPGQLWSTMNSHEMPPTTLGHSSVHESTASPDHTTMHAEDILETAWNPDSIPHANSTTSLSLPSDWVDLSSDFDINQFVNEFDKSLENANVESDY